MKTFLSRWWPSIIVFAVIIYATLSDDPTPDVDLPLIPGLDKLIHAIMFGGLVGAIIFDYVRAGFHLRPAVILTIALAVAAFGIIDEIAQATLTAKRAGDPLDWLADCLGILVAAFTAPPAVRRVLRRK